jgi:hypothetical protein
VTTPTAAEKPPITRSPLQMANSEPPEQRDKEYIVYALDGLIKSAKLQAL